MDELEQYFGQLADQIPTVADGNHDFIFSTRTLPVCPPRLVTDRIIIRKLKGDKPSGFRFDLLWFEAHKRTYRELGLLILSVIFQPEPDQVQLELNHPASNIKHLIVRFEYQDLDEVYPGYTTRPFAFSYYPDETKRHPWYDQHPNVNSLPCFFLTNLEECIVTEEQWAQRDTIIGFNTDEASVRLAELLLNIGRPENTVDQYDLEGEGGFRGVGEQSARNVSTGLVQLFSEFRVAFLASVAPQLSAD